MLNVGGDRPARTPTARAAGTPSARERRAAERRGRMAELVAASLLLLKGYRILARRHRDRLGEIDLIAVRGRRLAFVEVKLRRDREAAETATTMRQAARLADSAERWLWRHPRYREFEVGLDAILLGPRLLPRHVPNALNSW